MRAVLVSEFGGPDQLRLGQTADPLAGPTRALAALLDRQALRPVVSHVLPLAAAAEAHRILERRHASGKIILDVTR